MTASTFAPYRTTYADYLAVESCSEAKHEFIDGVIVAMAGGSLEHNRLELRMGVLLDGRVRLGCEAYPSNQRIWVQVSNHVRYSDGMIICGQARLGPHDGQAVANPLVIVEVLSSTTANDDKGAKRRDFQSLPSLEAYVLVAQAARRITVFSRNGAHVRGDAADQVRIYRSGESFDLPGLTAPIAVDEIYRGILDESGASLLR